MSSAPWDLRLTGICHSASRPVLLLATLSMMPPSRRRFQPPDSVSAVRFRAGPAGLHDALLCHSRSYPLSKGSQLASSWNVHILRPDHARTRDTISRMHFLQCIVRARQRHDATILPLLAYRIHCGDYVFFSAARSYFLPQRTCRFSHLRSGKAIPLIRRWRRDRLDRYSGWRSP